MNVYCAGTTSKKLISYVERVYDYLNINDETLVDVTITKTCSGGAAGYADGDDDLVNIEIARYDDAGKIPMKDMMINIAHEMVHAQQLASGRLINKGFSFATSPKGVNVMTTKQIFDGKEYIGVNYKDQPWEIEAYSLETKIYEECK